MSKISLRKEVFIAFSISEKEIKSLCSFISERHCDAQITFHCKDKTLRLADNIDELLNFPNLKQNQIVLLSIHCYSGYERIFDVSFSKNAFIEYNISAEEKDYLHIKDRIQSVVDSSKLWYSPLFSWNYKSRGILVWTLLSFVSLYFMSVYVFGGSLRLPGTDLLSPDHTFLIGLVLSYSWVLELIMSKFFFPKALFRIGRGIDRAQSYSKRREVLFGLIILGLIVGVAASVIAARI